MVEKPKQEEVLLFSHNIRKENYGREIIKINKTFDVTLRQISQYKKQIPSDFSFIIYIYVHRLSCDSFEAHIMYDKNIKQHSIVGVWCMKIANESKGNKSSEFNFLKNIMLAFFNSTTDSAVGKITNFSVLHSAW